MAKPIGVKIRKKIIPKIIGETIIPRKTPSCIHSLLKGSNISAFIKVADKITEAEITKKMPHGCKVFVKQKIAATRKTKVKKYPNFLLDGRIII